MQYAIIVTICAALNSPAERCDDYITDVLESAQECQIELAKQQIDAITTASFSCVIVRPDNATKNKVLP